MVMSSKYLRGFLYGGSVAFALLASGPRGQTAAAEKVTLALNLKPGQVFRQRLFVEQKIRMTIQGQQATTVQSFAFGYSLRVQTVDTDGTAACRIQYESVAIKQGGGLMPKLEYDSTVAGGKVPAGAKDIAAVVGQGYSVRIAPTGEVIDVEGADEFVAHLLKGFGMDPPREPGAGNAVVKAMLEQILEIYPQHPVDVGDSWNTRSTVYMGFPLIADNTFKLRARQGGRALIDVTSEVRSDPGWPPVVMGETRIRYELSGKHQGEIEVDEMTGWAAKSKVTEQVAGVTKLEGLPRAAQPQQWPVEMEIVFQIEPVGEQKEN